MIKCNFRLSLGSVYAIGIAAACGACSGASDSEVAGAAGSPSGGVSPSGGGGSSSTVAGSMATSGSSPGGQAMGGSSGTSGASGAGTEGGQGCLPRNDLTVGTHIVMNITWPDTLATTKGSGQFHLWNLSKFTLDGTAFTGETRACGSQLPPLELTAIAGGGQALIEMPDTIWDLPSMPKFPGSGALAGFAPGSMYKENMTNALVGLMMAEPEGAWPAAGSMITGVDHDGDSKPGLTGVPKADGGFVRPPTSILGQGGPIADQVYLVTRTAVALEGAMTSCTEHSGTATVKYFDNHVVGCHVLDGGECDATQADFIDSNRTIYAVTDASYTSKFLDDSATCADVRAALPQ